MQTEIIASICDIRPADWDALNSDNNPFTSHAFLSALEETGCVGGTSGWLPRYLVLKNEKNILAGLPLFSKTHSWGEYVFDWAWAEAWHRHGMQYYPKLIVAIPFSPVTGRRLLMTSETDMTKQLIAAATSYAESSGYSSLHWLFPTPGECTSLEQAGLQIRHNVQFQWHNQSYGSFSDFLATMTSRKRKKITRERRRVREQNLEFEVVTGHMLKTAHMDKIYEFYLRTIHTHGSQAYLNRSFFHLLGERLAENIVLILATREDESVAGALNIRSNDTLYGRYWGCNEEYDSLHFETCYYQAIEYCIQAGLSCFEGGAQGEHKLSRGFLPQITCSAHWMAENLLSSSITEFLDKEKVHVAHYRDLLNEHSPYKKD